MALTERNRPYQILIRFNEDGSIGANYRTIYESLRDGVVIYALENAPVPLAVAAGEPGAPFQEVLGEFANLALEANQTYQVQITGLTSSLEGARAQVDELTENAVKAKAEIDRLAAAGQDLETQLTQAQARIVELQNQLSSARSAQSTQDLSPQLSDSEEVGGQEAVNDLPDSTTVEEEQSQTAEQETPQK